MIPGGFTGLPTAGCPSDDVCAQSGVNIPNAALTNSGYYIYSEPTTRMTTLIVGGNATASWNSSPVVTPLEAYEIDNKIDDGVNHTGSFFGAGIADNTGAWLINLDNADTQCYNENTSTGYNTALDANSCGAVFVFGAGL
jgi:hypothetical protein